MATTFIFDKGPQRIVGQALVPGAARLLPDTRIRKIPDRVRARILPGTLEWTRQAADRRPGVHQGVRHDMDSAEEPPFFISSARLCVRRAGRENRLTPSNETLRSPVPNPRRTSNPDDRPRARWLLGPPLSP